MRNKLQELHEAIFNHSQLIEQAQVNSYIKASAKALLTLMQEYNQEKVDAQKRFIQAGAWGYKDDYNR